VQCFPPVKPQREPWEHRLGERKEEHEGGGRAEYRPMSEPQECEGAAFCSTTEERMRGYQSAARSGGCRLSVVDREECEEERGGVRRA